MTTDLKSAKKKRGQINGLADRIRRNPVVSLLILFGTFVIALSAFSDAAKNLFGLLARQRINVGGNWISDVLTNPYDNTDRFQLYFRFDVKGTAISGTVRETAVNGNYSYVRDILDGKIDGMRVSFRRPDSSNGIDNEGNPEEHKYSDFFSGEISDSKLRLRWESDRPGGFPVQNFFARRE